MITTGQAKRIARTYGIGDRTMISMAARTGFIPHREWESYADEVISLADAFKDPQGVYADARAWADFCERWAGFTVPHWHTTPEDKTAVPWAYKRGDEGRR